MRWLKAVFTSVSTMILGMFGGQKEKGARRFGIPGLAVTVGQLRALPLLLLIPTLVMGYGENSWLMGKIGSDGLVRVVYGALLSLPFAFYGFRRFLIALVMLVGAFQVRAGSLGYIGWFGDILIEDMFRYGILGLLISFNLFWKKSS